MSDDGNSMFSSGYVGLQSKRPVGIADLSFCWGVFTGEECTE